VIAWGKGSGEEWAAVEVAIDNGTTNEDAVE